MHAKQDESGEEVWRSKTCVMQQMVINNYWHADYDTYKTYTVVLFLPYTERDKCWKN